MIETTAQLEARITASCRRVIAMWPAMHQAGTPGSFASSTPSKALYTHDYDSEATDDLPRIDVLVDLRATHTATLHFYAKVLVEERKLTAQLPEGWDTLGLTRLIQRHADWWSGHEIGPDLAHDLHQIAHELTRAVFPNRTHLVRIGPCIECGATVRALPGATWVECRECGCQGSVGAWLSVLSDDELRMPTSTTGIAQILHRRLGFRVSERTLRRWAVDGLLVPVEPFGPQPLARWPMYDPVLVMRAVTRLYRACAMCGQPWNGEADVCLRCRPLMPTRPSRAKERPAPAARVAGSLARVAEDEGLTEAQMEQLYGPGRRCEESGMPRAWCRCASCSSCTMRT